MVFKALKKNKEPNVLKQWENQVKNTKKLKDNDLHVIVSPVTNTECYPSNSYVRENSYESSPYVDQTNSCDKDIVLDQNVNLRDSDETREMIHYGKYNNTTRTNAEAAEAGYFVRMDEYPPGEKDEKSTVVNSSGPDKLVYLYNELLSNPFLTCMTLPILPCLGLYVKTVKSSVPEKSGQNDIDATAYDSQDDDISPIDSAEKFSIDDEEEIFVPHINPSPYAPGNTNYSIGNPSMDDFGSGEVSFEETRQYMGDGYDGYNPEDQQYAGEMQYGYVNDGYHHHQGNYTYSNM